MKKLGLLIIVLSFIGTTGPLIASAGTPSLENQRVGEGQPDHICPCMLNKNTTTGRNLSTTPGTGSGNEKAKDATRTMGSGVGEQKSEPSSKPFEKK